MTEAITRYVHSIESQQTHLIRALQNAHRHSRQSIDHEDMKEIVEIVRRCGYDFEEVPETVNKLQTAARIHESSTCSTVGGDASKGVNLDAFRGAQNFTQTTSDDRTYSMPQKRRKRELEPDADMTFVSNATDSVVGVDMYGHSPDGQSQMQMLSSAQMVTTAPSAQNTNHIDPQAIGAEVSNLRGQSKQIGPWPDIDSGLSRKLNSPDTLSNTFHEPDVSSVVTPNAWLPAPSPTEFDTQFTNLNHTDLSLTPFPAASDTFDPQAIFDMDSVVWWDPSSLYDASIGDIGHIDSAS